MGKFKAGTRASRPNFKLQILSDEKRLVVEIRGTGGSVLRRSRRVPVLRGAAVTARLIAALRSIVAALRGTIIPRLAAALRGTAVPAAVSTAWQ